MEVVEVEVGREVPLRGDQEGHLPVGVQVPGVLRRGLHRGQLRVRAQVREACRGIRQFTVWNLSLSLILRTF